VLAGAGLFAAFETDVRREREAEGIAKVKRAGIYKGGVKCIDRVRYGRASRKGRVQALAQEMGPATLFATWRSPLL